MTVCLLGNFSSCNPRVKVEVRDPLRQLQKPTLSQGINSRSTERGCFQIHGAQDAVLIRAQGTEQDGA